MNTPNQGAPISIRALSDSLYAAHDTADTIDTLFAQLSYDLDGQPVQDRDQTRPQYGVVQSADYLAQRLQTYVQMLTVVRSVISGESKEVYASQLNAVAGATRPY